jgi:hypothetical protein
MIGICTFYKMHSKKFYIICTCCKIYLKNAIMLANIGYRVVVPSHYLCMRLSDFIVTFVMLTNVTLFN